jgi:hypothetical protein
MEDGEEPDVAEEVLVQVDLLVDGSEVLLFRLEKHQVILVQT